MFSWLATAVFLLCTLPAAVVESSEDSLADSTAEATWERSLDIPTTADRPQPLVRLSGRPGSYRIASGGTSECRKLGFCGDSFSSGKAAPLLASLPASQSLNRTLPLRN